MKKLHVCAFVTLIPVMFSLKACKQNEAKNVQDLTLKIADDVCGEIENDKNIDNEWITLICSGVDIANKIKIIMPRKEWHAIKARKFSIDAGPGK